MAHHHRRNRLASLLLPVALLGQEAAAGTLSDPRPPAAGKDQHRTHPDPHPWHHDLSFRLRTLGWMPLGIPGKDAGLRCPAVCHRRMSQARHGAPRLGGYHPCRKMGSAGMQEPPEEIPGTHQKDRCRWIYESGRQPYR